MTGMQCQREVARFAAGPARVNEVRHSSVRAAVRFLVLGDREAALQVMYDGLVLQAPLSFKPPRREVA